MSKPRPGQPGWDGTTRERPRWRRPVLVAALVVAVLVVGFLLYLEAQLSGIRRAPLLADFAGTHGAGTNVLLVGSEHPADSLAVDPATLVVQLVHVSADGTQAAVVHVPRDMYLPVAGAGARRQTLLAAYQRGGDPLVVQTLQQDLGLNIDHVVQVGFEAYVRVTDRLGGVDLPTPEGSRHFTGAQALAYADATSGLVNGTVDTGHRHQEWLKAMLKETLTPTVLLNPFAVVGLLHDTTSRVVVDDGFTTGAMRGLAWRSRQLRGDTIRYLTAPYQRFADRGAAGRVLVPDLDALTQLGAALRTDNSSAIASFDN